MSAMAVIITILSNLVTPATAPIPAAGGVDLCCHYHDDGSTGCWPDATSNIECDGWIQNCSQGAAQTDLDDEESWACASSRVS